MRDIGAEIRKRRERLNWTGTKLATLAGISAPFLSRIETGKSYYSRETVMKIAGALGTTVEALYAGGITNVEHTEPGWRRIPVLDVVQASQWTAQSVPGEEQMRETVMTDLEHPPSTFAMRVFGDSMEPGFHEGDMVLIDPTIHPEPGDYVVASVTLREAGGEATFRQFRNAGLNERGESVFELCPLNPLHAPMRSDRQAIRLVGVMVEHRRFRRR